MRYFEGAILDEDANGFALAERVPHQKTLCNERKGTMGENEIFSDQT